MSGLLKGIRVFISTCAAADDRKTLAAVRSLARAGARVTVGSDHPTGPPQASRACSGTFVHPSPTGDPDGFVDALAGYFEREPHDVLMPLSDETTDPIAVRAGRLEGRVRMAIPPDCTIRRAFDKQAMLALADRLGIATPMTRTADSRETLERVAAEMIYPCIVKPRRGSASAGFRVVGDAQGLMRYWDGMNGSQADMTSWRDLLIQERIPGFVHDICVLCDRGRLRAGSTQKRLLMWPPDGGVGILVETTHEPALIEIGRRMMEALAWHGPGQVEVRVDERDGEPRLMEVNGRFWGTVDLAIQAGVDYPLLACLLALGRPVPETFDYRVGLRYRWPLPRGLRYVLATGDLTKLWTFLGPGAVSDIRLSDLRPSWYELWK